MSLVLCTEESGVSRVSEPFCTRARCCIPDGLTTLDRLLLVFNAFLSFYIFFTAALLFEPHKSKAGAGISSVYQHQNRGGWCIRCGNLFSGNVHILVSFKFDFLY